MSYIKHDFGRTFYLSKGRQTKEKAALICLHGGPGGRHDTFKELFDKTQDRKIVLYDQIGGGRSTPLKKNQQKISTFLYELDEIRKQLKIKNFHLYGGSWGTTLALEYYFHCKGRGFQSITFQSPMFSARDWENDGIRLIKNMPKQTQKVISYCHEIGATDSQVYQKAVFDYYLKHVLRDRKKLLMKKTPNPHGQDVYLNMWGPSEFKPTGTLKTYDKVHLLKKIEVPTQIVVGEHDEATPKTAKRYAKLIKSAEFHVIKNASHSILSEQAAKMIKTINVFIKKHDPN